MKIQPYLFFEGRCEEAFDFYKIALGAKEALLMRPKDNPDSPETTLCHRDLKIRSCTWSLASVKRLFLHLMVDAQEIAAFKELR